MQNNPLFSIITPTYNRGYMIWKTIQSVQSQTYPYWELIIVDDGSTDDTEKVVAEFQNDPRIKYFKTENKGESHARNQGLKQAKGDFMAFLDSDDTIYPNYIEIILEYFKKNPNKVFGVTNYNYRVELYENNKLMDFTEVKSSEKEKIDLQDYYHWTVKIYSSGIFHRADAYKKGLSWDESIKVAQDVDYILQLGDLYPEGFMHIPYVLIQYNQRYGGDSVTSNTRYDLWAENYEKIYQKHKNSPLMKGQSWYPEKIKKYQEMQKQFLQGKIPSVIYRYFPNYHNEKEISTKS